MRFVSALALLALATSAVSAIRIAPTHASETNTRARANYSEFLFEEDADSLDDTCKVFSDEYQCSQNSDQCRWSKNDKACYAKLGPFSPNMQQEQSTASVSRKIQFLQHNSNRMGFIPSELLEEEEMELKPTTPTTPPKQSQPGCQWINLNNVCAGPTTNKAGNGAKKPYKATPTQRRDSKIRPEEPIVEQVMEIYEELIELFDEDQQMALHSSFASSAFPTTPVSTQKQSQTIVSQIVCKAVNGTLKCL